MRNSERVRDNAKRFLALLVLCGFMIGCASVDITKTSTAILPPTDPRAVEIIKVTPYRSYEQLASLTISGFDTSHTEEMHRAIRARAASVGANAVILTGEGLSASNWGGYEHWATGIAIRYTAAAPAE